MYSDRVVSSADGSNVLEAVHEVDTRRAFIGGAAAVGAAGLLRARVASAAGTAAAKPCTPAPPGVRTDAIAVTPSGRTIWATDSSGTTIRAFARKDFTPGASIDVGGTPVGIAIAPDGRTALVTTAAYDRPGLAVVDLRTGKVVRLAVGPRPHSIAFSPDGRLAYVTGGAGAGTLTPVRLKNRHAGQPINVGRDPQGIAVSPDGKHALVALNGDSRLALVSLAHPRVVKRIRTPAYPSRVAISPDGRRALVTHNGYGNRKITPVDLKKRKSGPATNVGLDPAGVAYAASGTAVVTAMGTGRVAVVNGSTGRRRKLLTIGGAPRGVVVAGRTGVIADALTGKLTAVRIGVL